MKAHKQYINTQNRKMTLIKKIKIECKKTQTIVQKIKIKNDLKQE
jgi:hypothetical protein